jgi:hypothetical protein
MVFPVIGGDGKPTGYDIDNSLRFNDGDSPSLQFTPSSAGNEKTWTVSFWVKRGVVTTSSAQMIFCSDTNYDEYVFCRFCGTENTGKEDELQVLLTEPNGRQSNVTTSRKFRDPSAWYHIVVRCDTTQSTSTNRLRVYVNGSQETSFRDNSQLNQNDDNINWNSNVPQAIGHQKQASSVERHLDGYLAEFYNIDGTSLGPDSFGETNDNGVWIPKDAKNDLTFGTNGYYLQFKQTGTSANSSGIGADTSGNDHHWTPANLAAIDVTVDTPTNNFATFNPLDNYYQQYTYAEGNLKITTNADYYNWNTSTIGVTSGKWYVEGKATQVGTGSDNWVFGIAVHSPTNNNQGIGADNFSIGYRNNGNYKTGDSNSTHGASFSEGDIVMIALDLDNDNVYFGSGGQWADGSGNTDEASPNSAVSLSNLRGSSSLGNTVFFGFGDWNTNASSTVSIGEFNFGNPVHSISSGNADANGYGNFEYAVPSGYYSLCTKNLAEYG